MTGADIQPLKPGYRCGELTNNFTYEFAADSYWCLWHELLASMCMKVFQELFSSNFPLTGICSLQPF